jgi:hypothetical protein
MVGGRDLNPGPHGPESHDIPSRSVDLCLLQFDSSDSAALLVQIGVKSSAGLLHEVLQNAGRQDGFQRDQALRSPWDRPAAAPRMPRFWERVHTDGHPVQLLNKMMG